MANICREVIANAYWIGGLNGVSDKPGQLGYLVKARIENRKRPMDRLTCDYIRTFFLPGNLLYILFVQSECTAFIGFSSVVHRCFRP